MKRLISAVLALLLPVLVFAGPLWNNIREITLDYPHAYFIYVDKEAKELKLIDRQLDVKKVYKIASGAQKGNKLYRGDMRTPEGVYSITEIYSYAKPWWVEAFEERVKEADAAGRDTKTLKDGLKARVDKYEAGKRRLSSMNALHLKASDGHRKFGSDEDLGTDAYGPVFMRINYPDAGDRKRHNEAKAKGLVPQGRGIGGGIAIHGTNDGESLGHDATTGCVRLNNSGIEELARYVQKGMMVIIERTSD
ncbi:MAG TPA: L,D-transpeptidase [bacterium]|nr:L,D-transpeptidase [bacterium]